jgi:hypothetical protein
MAKSWDDMTAEEKLGFLTVRTGHMIIGMEHGEDFSFI